MSQAPTLGIATVASLRARHAQANAGHAESVKPPSSAAKSLPPPPPLAAFVQRVDRPARVPETQLAVLAEPAPSSDWSEHASDHFGSSVRAPKPVRVWGARGAALAVAGLAVLGAGFAAGLVSPRSGPTLHSIQTGSALASAQHTALVAQPKQPAIPATPASVPVTQAAHDATPSRAKALLPAALVLPPLAAKPSAPNSTTTARIEPAATVESAEVRAKVAEPTRLAAAQPEPAPVATSDEALPEQPTREQIKDVLIAVRPALEACSANAHGTMFASLNITGSGRVSYSSIEGAFAGSSQGSCMARALRSAAFPRFASASLKVRYPFVL